MSSEIERQDADYAPPMEDGIIAIAMAAGVATAVQDTGILGAGTLMPSQFVTIGCDQVFYMTWSKTDGSSTVTDPVIGSVAGASRTMGPYQPGVISLRATTRRRYFKAITATAGTLRWYLSTGPGVL